MPASLLQAVKGLHEHMQSEFAQHLEQVQQSHNDALRAEQQALAATHAALSGELERTQAALAQLQATHHVQSVRLATIEADNAGLQQRLTDRVAEVQTLDRQLSQARTQFEYYQDATAVQRAEERQAYDQRIARLEHELAGANRHIAAQQTTLGQQEAQLAHLTADLSDRQQAQRKSQEALATERRPEMMIEARPERRQFVAGQAPHLPAVDRPIGARVA